MLADAARTEVIRTIRGQTICTHVVSTISRLAICADVISTVLSQTICTYVISAISSLTVCTDVICAVLSQTICTYMVSAISGLAICANVVCTVLSDLGRVDMCRAVFCENWKRERDACQHRERQAENQF